MSNVYLLSLGADVLQKGNGVDSVVVIATNEAAAITAAEAATGGDVAGIWSNATATVIGEALAADATAAGTADYADGTVFTGTQVSFTAPVAAE